MDSEQRIETVLERVRTAGLLSYFKDDYCWWEPFTYTCRRLVCGEKSALSENGAIYPCGKSFWIGDFGQFVFFGTETSDCYRVASPDVVLALVDSLLDPAMFRLGTAIGHDALQQLKPDIGKAYFVRGKHTFATDDARFAFRSALTTAAQGVAVHVTDGDYITLRQNLTTCFTRFPVTRPSGEKEFLVLFDSYITAHPFAIELLRSLTQTLHGLVLIDCEWGNVIEFDDPFYTLLQRDERPKAPRNRELPGE